MTLTAAAPSRGVSAPLAALVMLAGLGLIYWSLSGLGVLQPKAAA